MSHSTRRRIVDYLSQGNATFSELRKHVDIKDHGKFGFHLRALRAVEIVEQDASTKKYSLTEQGWVVVGLSSILKGITERRQVEERVTLLSRIIEQTREAVVITDIEGRYIYLNDAYVKLRGYTREELMNRDFRETYSDTERNLMMKAFKEMVTSVFWTGELPYTHKDGSVIIAMVTAVLLKSETGDPYAVAGIIREITERKKVEKALRESEERFKQVVENALEWIWEVDVNGIYTHSSQIVEKILGYTPEEIVGKKGFYELFHPEDRDELKKAAFARFSQKQAFREFVNRNVHKNGNTVWLSTSGVPILDDGGNLLGYRGADTDITQRKRMEDELKRHSERLEELVEEKTQEVRESEEELRSLLENIPDFVITVDRDYNILMINRGAPDVTVEQAMGTKVYNYVEPAHHEIMKASLEKVFQTGKPEKYEVLGMGPTGPNTAWYETRVFPNKIANQVPSVTLISSNITKRKRLDEERSQLLHDYGERIKELNCLYGISKLAEKSKSIEETLREIVKLLPSAWLYPDVTCARIMYGEGSFVTDNFRETRWKQSADIKVHGNNVGSVEVYYLEERPDADEGPFFKEERNLINSVTEQVGRTVENMKLRKGRGN
ncbi:MAG: PAS domain S-box protein [Candidatus Bathyarchaeota archaeon]|nr:PAS domain S-box protein [Candidatus Bathyarchaeota archaeon]